MKKLMSLSLIFVFILSSCSSDEPGPRGPQGPPGEPGEPGLIGSVFDIEDDFTSENDYSLFVTFSNHTDIEVFETDIVQVYLLVGQDEDSDGQPIDVWRPLPQTYYPEEERVTYNYDYTFFDVNIFLESSMELSAIGSEFTEGQVFRIAILPADFAEEMNIDINSYQEVMSALEITDREIPVLEMK